MISSTFQQLKYGPVLLVVVPAGRRRVEGRWGHSRTSGLVGWSIKEKLPTEAGRVLRGVDREADGPRVVEDLIVVSPLKRAPSKDYKLYKPSSHVEILSAQLSLSFDLWPWTDCLIRPLLSCLQSVNVFTVGFDHRLQLNLQTEDPLSRIR